jgi:hypothetical protein
MKYRDCGQGLHTSETITLAYHFALQGIEYLVCSPRSEKKGEALAPQEIIMQWGPVRLLLVRFLKNAEKLMSGAGLENYCRLYAVKYYSTEYSTYTAFYS